MKRPIKPAALLLLAAIGMLVLSACGAPAAAIAANGSPADQLHTISVTGSGSAYAAPDTATAQIGVQTRDVDPAKSVSANTEKMTSIIAALKEGLARWPTGTYAIWYPIKQRRTLLPFLRKVAKLQCKSALIAELLVRPDDSPLRLNGSGMLIVNPPYQLDQELAPALPVLARLLGDKNPSSTLQWIKQETP